MASHTPSSPPTTTLAKLMAGATRLGIALSPHQLSQFERYLAELLEWNQRVNLTAVTEPAEVETRHFLDSLTVVLAFPDGLAPGNRLLDVDAGAGFPGLPLKIACPSLRLSLLDSVGKKTAFLAHLCGVLGLDDVEVYTGRAEDLARTPLREAFHAVVSRAVAPLNVLAELTLPFCAVGGLTVAMKQADAQEELEQARAGISELGGKVEAVIPVELEGLAPKRALVAVRKVTPTPDRYPRRPGVPAKRPL